MHIPKPLLAAAALVLSSAPAAGQGRWLASYPEAQDPTHAAMREMFIQQDMLSTLVEQMNGFMRVPRDVTIEIAECGRPGAFYDPARPAVQLCYELVMHLTKTAQADGGMVLAGALGYVLMHQLGHALVDVLGLPVDVSAEEAADQFAVVLTAFANREWDPEVNGEMPAIMGGIRALRDRGPNWENPGSPDAALTPQRVRMLACLLYGSSPEAHAAAIGPDGITPGRGEACAEKYAEIEDRWVQMLDKYAEG